MKTNSQQSFLFRFKYSSKQFPLPTQFRSFPMTHYMSQSNALTTAVQTNILGYLMHLSNQTNFPKQANTAHSVVNSQPQHQVPLCLQCHDGSYLSLSQHSSTYTARQTPMLQAPISRSPVSANIRQAPLLLHTTQPQVFNYSRITLHMWQLNQGHWQSKLDPPWFSCQRFSNLWQLNQVTDLSGFSCQSFSTLWQLNQGYWPSVVLMPNFLNSAATKPRPTTLRGSHAKLSLFNCHLQAWRQAQ